MNNSRHERFRSSYGLSGTKMNSSMLSTSSLHSVQTSTRESPTSFVINPDTADYKDYKKVACTQILLDNYRMLKKTDLRQNKIKSYMNGIQDNLYEEEKKIEERKVGVSLESAGVYGLDIKLNPEIKS